MASSTHDHRHVSAPSITAPPPTPTATHPLPSSATPDLLSHLLLRLPPSLALPTGRRHTAVTPPVISLSSNTLPSSLRSVASQLGFFQITSHSVPPHLARSAEAEYESLFISSPPNHSVSSGGFPVGYDDHHDTFCFDSASFTESTRSLGELARELERVGMEVLEAGGFGNPAGEVRSLMWVSKSGRGDELAGPGRVYPYVVGLQYQIRCGKVSLLVDSGPVSVSAQVDSIFITFGDIAQVWSNGKVKKVRGRPVPIIFEEAPHNSTENAINCISMTLLLTLPLGSIVSPHIKSVECEKDGESDEDTIMFDSFPFEDYAWRVYHERLHLEDPLDRYRLV